MVRTFLVRTILVRTILVRAFLVRTFPVAPKNYLVWESERRWKRSTATTPLLDKLACRTRATRPRTNPSPDLTTELIMVGRRRKISTKTKKKFLFRKFSFHSFLSFDQMELDSRVDSVNILMNSTDVAMWSCSLSRPRAEVVGKARGCFSRWWLLESLQRRKKHNFSPFCAKWACFALVSTSKVGWPPRRTWLKINEN